MMNEPGWLRLRRALVDTGVFILWHRGDQRARYFLRNPDVDIYFAKVTRKELLHPAVSDAERQKLIELLTGFRQVNPEAEIAAAYSVLLNRYPYLRDHLADTLIAATAWVKHLPIVTTNARHFRPIQEIEVVTFD
jgi:predicted nucleic acid-binding protein